MEEFIGQVGRYLLDIAIYIANGALITGYWLLGQAPLMVALLCGLVILYRFDPLARQTATFMPGRPDLPQPREREIWGHQVLTLVALTCWLCAAATNPWPVPWMGAAMWAVAVVGLILLPAERLPYLWRAKSFLILYSLILFGFRTYLLLVSNTTPAQWAAVFGTADDAQRIIAGNRSLFLTIGTWISWFALPVAQIGYLIQRLLINPMSLMAPAMTAGEIVHAIRNRHED